jgi:GrpB-like predicted nucleotidyltransferase (UPF0157 family)
MQPVASVSPKFSWAEEFHSLGQTLRNCLGDLALRIDHIGSTSVPGLAAKDVIDLQVTVADLDLTRLQPAFELAGFEHHADNPGDHRPPGSNGSNQDWAKLYFSPKSGHRDAHVHVRVLGRPNQRYALLFRDYLRARPGAAAAYAELKRRMAKLGISRAVYSDVKDPACDIIIAAAEEWAQHTGWTVGPSDV